MQQFAVRNSHGNSHGIGVDLFLETARLESSGRQGVRPIDSYDGFHNVPSLGSRSPRKAPSAGVWTPYASKDTECLSGHARPRGESKD
jgi:hypothetical protein